MSNNTQIVISQALIGAIKQETEKVDNLTHSVDQAMVEIGYIVDAYNDYFRTGRGEVSVERSSHDE